MCDRMKIYSYVKSNNLEINRLDEDIIYVNRNYLTLKKNKKMKKSKYSIVQGVYFIEDINSIIFFKPLNKNQIKKLKF